MIKDNYGKCAKCPIKPQTRTCMVNDGVGPIYCSTKNYPDALVKADEKYQEKKYSEFAKQASIQEYEGYESVPDKPGVFYQKNLLSLKYTSFVKKWDISVLV